MKVIRVDNYARESRPEYLEAEGLTLLEAKDMLEKLRRERPHGEEWWYESKSDEYRLWRGTEDLV